MSIVCINSPTHAKITYDALTLLSEGGTVAMKFDHSEHLRNIHELIQNIQNAKQVDELTVICSQLADTLEMDYFCYGLELPAKGKEKSGEEPQPALFSNYADSWMEEYIEQGYAEVDPTVLHCISGTEPLIWDSAQHYKYSSDKKSQLLMAGALDHDINSGVLLPLQDQRCQIAGFNLVSKQAANKINRHMEEITPYITFFSNFLHEKMLSLHQTKAVNLPSPITQREADCLCWAAAGKTASEVADILNVSEHTIHFHLKNAIKKLHSTNKTHAVAKAIVSGYIHPNLK